MIHKQVCAKAFNKKMNSFVQQYGSRQLDASSLLIARVGFLLPGDPRILGTVEATERELMQDGLVMCYDTSKAKDGLAGSEDKFLACSFWLVSNVNLNGRDEDAHDTKRNRLVWQSFLRPFPTLLLSVPHFSSPGRRKRNAMSAFQGCEQAGISKLR